MYQMHIIVQLMLVKWWDICARMLQAEQLGISKMKSRHDTNESDRYRKATIMRKKENV